MERDVVRRLETGTTTIGLVFKDGVILATERRATMGTLIAHKLTKKLYKIDDNIGLAVAGLVGDAQILARYFTAEVELYRLKYNEQMSIKGGATLLSNILAGRRVLPYWVHLIIGGVDRNGAHVYSLDPAGGAIPDVYITAGSGSPYAYGVLEDHYRHNMGVNEATDVSIRALHAAMKRDAASGDGIDLAQVTQKGFKMLTDDEINKRKNKLGIK